MLLRILVLMLVIPLSAVFAQSDYENLSRLLQQERYTDAIEQVESFPDLDRHFALCMIYGLWGYGEQAIYHCDQFSSYEDTFLECALDKTLCIVPLHAEVAWDLYLYYSAKALAYYRLKEYDDARESIAMARQLFEKDWRLDLLEALMDDRDLSTIEVHSFERQEFMRLIPILRFGGVDNR